MGGSAMSPATVGDVSMDAAGRQSLAQGEDFAAIHRAQHGGAAVSLAAAAPVGYTGMLDDSLRMTARISPLDAAVGAIQGMRDQSGGGRRNKKGGRIARSLRAASKKVKDAQRKMMKMMRRFSMKLRKMRGGAALIPADYGAPGMLLGSADSAKALMGMNPEWKLAADPTAFAPK